MNPLLTISALSERAIELLAAEKGWTIATGPTPPLPPTPATPTPGLRFTERMAGWAGPAADGDPAARRGAGRGRRHPPRVRPHHRHRRPPRHARRPRHPRAPQRHRGRPGAVPPTAAGGGRDASGSPRRTRPTSTPGTCGTRWCSSADDGRRFRFEGHKVLHDRFGLDLWSDTTTLYVTISDEAGEPVVGGVMRIAPADFARQLTTLQVTGVDGRAERLRWKGRFGKRFFRSLTNVYGEPRRRRRVPRGPAAPHPADRRRASQAAAAGARAALVRRRRTLARGRLGRGGRPRPAPAGSASSATRAAGADRCCSPPGSACRPRRSSIDTVAHQPDRAPGRARATTSGCSTTGPASTSRRRRRRSRSTTSPGSDWPDRRGRGPPGHRRGQRAGARPLRRLGLADDGAGRRPRRRALGGVHAVPAAPGDVAPQHVQGRR